MPSKRAPMLQLPGSLEPRRGEFAAYLNGSVSHLACFACKQGWERQAEESRVDEVTIFDDKARFDRELVRLLGMDASMEIPRTYCATLYRRQLIAVAPEIYQEVYPQGVEARGYGKLLIHELAHWLHVSLLEGDEAAMGPVWFYEGRPSPDCRLEGPARARGCPPTRRLPGLRISVSAACPGDSREGTRFSRRAS